MVSCYLSRCLSFLSLYISCVCTYDTDLSGTVFLSLCFNCVCPYVTVLLLCVSVVCIRTSPVSLISSSLSFFLWASVVGVRTRTSLYYCLFLDTLSSACVS